jgi:hypothetical protein
VNVKAGNLLSGLPSHPLTGEVVETLCERPALRFERIVSTGQSTPEGEWYDQTSDEFVLLVSGAARLRLEGGPTIGNSAKAISFSCQRIAVIVSSGLNTSRRRSGWRSISSPNANRNHGKPRDTQST